MNSSRLYDYIIAGAGCSGLSLAIHLIESERFADKKILLIDKDIKKANDRTWCFWQKEEGLFEPIIYKQWQRLRFHGEDHSSLLHLQPYHYKMIRGIDFYEYCLQIINRQTNVDILFDTVESVFSEEKTGVVVKGERIYSDYVFNSILFDKPVLRSNEYWLLQHFLGWTIETDEDCFDAEVATLMDFRVSQLNGAAFCYVLPVTSRKALIEYTLFSSQLLQRDEYERAVEGYIKEHLNLSSYQINEKEFGVIPMTNHKFPTRQNNIVNIGTAGGQTKGSSGYTFNFIQKHSKAIVESLIATGKPFLSSEPRRFNFYDGILLKVLSDGIVPGNKIFTDLFRKNAVQKVFRFLDNETNLAEEVKIISTLPTLPFLKAGIRHLL
ncbi:MAG TPA: lycopene cyclase family protein [Flavisolibacter sp.]